MYTRQKGANQPLASPPPPPKQRVGVCYLVMKEQGSSGGYNSHWPYSTGCTFLRITAPLPPQEAQKRQREKRKDSLVFPCLRPPSSLQCGQIRHPHTGIVASAGPPSVCSVQARPCRIDLLGCWSSAKRHSRGKPSTSAEAAGSCPPDSLRGGADAMPPRLGSAATVRLREASCDMAYITTLLQRAYGLRSSACGDRPICEPRET